MPMRAGWQVSLLVGALSCATCDRPASGARPDSGFAEAPNTAGVEGHGGIEVAGAQRPAGGRQEPVRPPPPDHPWVGGTGAPDSSAHPADLFMVAYSEKDMDPEAAARGFKRVVELTEPGTPLHDKAARWLEKLAADQAGH
ncbi:MAG: hypothetical protein ACYC8T_09490 [Myxococcaceae bacterium]